MTIGAYAQASPDSTAGFLSKRTLASQERLWRWFFCGPVLVGASAFVALPILLGLALSFFHWPTVGARSFSGFQNFRSLLSLSNDETWLAIRNTVVFGLANLAFIIVLALALAAWINTKPAGWRVIRILLFLPALTPLVADSLVWSAIYSPGTGLVAWIWHALGGSINLNLTGSPSTALGSVLVVSVWHNVGYNVLLFSAALEAVPESQVDAAKMDGASSIRRFVSIILPLISPTVFFASVISLVGSMQVFARVFVLTDGGPGLSSLTLGLEIYNRAFNTGELGSAAAIGILLLIILLMFTGLLFQLQKRLVYYELDPGGRIR